MILKIRYFVRLLLHLVGAYLTSFNRLDSSFLQLSFDSRLHLIAHILPTGSISLYSDASRK
jgi:hypothetical protein